ncbi:hypothetical protein CB1_001219019 [Camelus ferus]|nr:hypothetical protein CB1_001219019 [Camelus ferus]
MGDVSWELENEQSPGGGRDEVMPRLHTTPEEVKGEVTASSVLRDKARVDLPLSQLETRTRTRSTAESQGAAQEAGRFTGRGLTLTANRDGVTVPGQRLRYHGGPTLLNRNLQASRVRTWPWLWGPHPGFLRVRGGNVRTLAPPAQSPRWATDTAPLYRTGTGRLLSDG